MQILFLQIAVQGAFTAFRNSLSDLNVVYFMLVPMSTIQCCAEFMQLSLIKQTHLKAFGFFSSLVIPVSYLLTFLILNAKIFCDITCRVNEQQIYISFKYFKFLLSWQP